MTVEQLREVARYWFHPAHQSREVTPGTVGQLFDLLASLTERVEALERELDERDKG